METMNRKEVAKYLRIQPLTVFDMVKAGTIPAYRVGRQWRFDKTAIDAWKVTNSNQKTEEG